MHEYGHYLIGCLCALDFQQRVLSQKINSFVDFTDWCHKMFKETLNEYLKL